MDDLKNRWKKAKQSVVPTTLTVEQLIVKAHEKKKSVLFFHYGNIGILSFVLIGLSLFFYYVAPFKEAISRIGVALMLGGLLIRILIEFFSTLKSRKIQLTQDVSETTHNTLSFYKFRKKIHGPVTITIVALYILGFYMLSPEFSKYIAFEWMVSMHISFIVGAIFLVWQIRKGIRREMENLTKLIELNRELNTVS